MFRIHPFGVASDGGISNRYPAHHEKVSPPKKSFKDVPHGKSWPSLDNVKHTADFSEILQHQRDVFFFNPLFYNGIHHLSTGAGVWL